MGSKLDGQKVLKESFDDDNSALRTLNASSLVPDQYDEIVMTYVGSDMTEAIYKFETVTVATLTLTYSSGNLTKVVKS